MNGAMQIDLRKFYINGHWVTPHSTQEFPVLNPATEAQFATTILGDQTDVDAAVAAAKDAFASFSQTTKQERLALLEALMLVTAPTRLLVERSVYDQVLDIAKRAAQDITTGQNPAFRITRYTGSEESSDPAYFGRSSVDTVIATLSAQPKGCTEIAEFRNRLSTRVRLRVSSPSYPAFNACATSDASAATSSLAKEAPRSFTGRLHNLGTQLVPRFTARVVLPAPPFCCATHITDPTIPASPAQSRQARPVRPMLRRSMPRVNGIMVKTLVTNLSPNEIEMPFLSVLMLFLTALTASAGAWPQQKGQAFVSVTSNLSFPDIYMIEAEPSMYQALYVEYGLTDKLTLGVDAGRSVAGKGKTVVFLRHPVFAGREKAKYAVELGVGKIAGRSVLRPGMSFGRWISDRKTVGMDVCRCRRRTGYQ
ncbi:3-succinoylsemialdehyde-pyridine dehydrogenase [Nymphon striatum]|nr:3-succinoylsemialdehyde-pyridine dehydrogenase [Nymphon striatum]